MKKKLEQFLEWLEEEDPYPILNHGILVAFVEKYELEIETSSENAQWTSIFGIEPTKEEADKRNQQILEEWYEENAGIGEEL